MPTSRPNSFARASFSSELALPITNAPASFASCTAAEPMPLPTELISTVSPGWSFPRVKSMCHDVANAICVAAAASSESASGTRMRWRAEHASRSAYPPVVEKLMNPGARQSDSRPVLQYRQSPHGFIRYGSTRSPTSQPVTPSPSAAIRPTTSQPRMNGGSTGKREIPSRMSTSRWFRPHARISSVTSPGPGSGIRDLLEPENVRPTELVEHHRLHATTSPLDDE